MSITLEGWGGGAITTDGWGHLPVEVIVERHRVCLALSFDTDCDVALAMEQSQALGLGIQTSVAVDAVSFQADQNLDAEYQDSVALAVVREDDC